MQASIITDRLSISFLTINDHSFIVELLNSKGWIEFIGDKNINSKNAAILYIKKILGTQGCNYWVVRLKDNNTPIGIISFMKRDYLKHPDIGFAFLPQFMGNGYAYEGAKDVLQRLSKNPDNKIILATTVPQNIRSAKLLKKLGLHFDEEIEIRNKILNVYSFTVPGA